MASIVAGAAFLCGAAASQATVIAVADYKLGEDDPGAAAGNAGNTTTVDSSGNGFDLSKVGSANYAASNLPGYGPLSMSFTGAGYYSGSTVTNATENFGILAFVKPTDVSGTQAIAINGSGCCSGFGLFLDNGRYYGLYGGLAVEDIGAAVAGTWAYLALVNEGGVTTSYFNLVANPPSFIGDPHPANAPVCCAPPLHMTIGSDGSHDFMGLINRVAVFTFAPGEFDPSDLLPKPVPEPASLLLFSIGLATFGFAKRRKR